MSPDLHQRGLRATTKTMPKRELKRFSFRLPDRKYDTSMIAVSENLPPTETTTDSPALAPWIHTLFLVGVLFLWAIYGAFRFRLPANIVPHAVTYASGAVVQYLLLGSTIAGLYHRRQFIRSVLGFRNPRIAFRAFGAAVLIYLCGIFVMAIVRIPLYLTRLHSTFHRETLKDLLPQNLSELAFWILLSITAGFCEEFVFRGYLQQQLSKWFPSLPVGIAVSATIFGCMHFYQGGAAVLQLTALGTLYGIVAVRRGNLRGVMVAHALQDVTVGVIYYLKSHW
jgi:membrane protease YdiL (CAAX protease family)